VGDGRAHERVDDAAEELVLHQIDEDAGPEHADHFVHGEEDGEEHRPSPGRVDAEPPRAAREADAPRRLGRGASRAVPAGERVRVAEHRLVVAGHEGRGPLRVRQGTRTLEDRGHRRADVRWKREVVGGTSRLADRAPELVDADSARRHRRPHGDAEGLRESLRVDPQAARLGLVGHVQAEDGRDAELPELQREHEGAPEVLRVRDLDDGDIGIAPRRGEEVPRDPLVLGEGNEGVHAGRVHELDSGSAREDAARHLNRRARVVRDRRAQPRERVEERALADVRVPHEEDPAASLGALGRASGPAFVHGRQ
jgi:hypothetical protein